MSLQPQSLPAIPEEIDRVARVVSPKGNLFIQMRSELDVITAVSAILILR